MADLLSVRNLTARYGPIIATREVGLDVRHGEIIALLGANGAGKSTTLMSIMGLLRSRTGSIRFLGEEVIGLGPEAIVRRGMVLVPEGRRIFAGLCVADNLRLAAAGPGRSRSESEDDLATVHELFPILADRAEAAAGSLSGGEQQQLAIGRALVSRPKVLLLDEPTLGLAPKLVRAIFDLIGRLRDEQGLTVLIVEQNVRQALKLCDRAYVMRNGLIEGSGPPSELSAETLDRAYLGGTMPTVRGHG